MITNTTPLNISFMGVISFQVYICSLICFFWTQINSFKKASLAMLETPDPQREKEKYFYAATFGEFRF